MPLRTFYCKICYNEIETLLTEGGICCEKERIEKIGIPARIVRFKPYYDIALGEYINSKEQKNKIMKENNLIQKE